MPTNSKIAIIIVTYRPNWKIIEKNVQELGKKNSIYISDNGTADLKEKTKRLKKYSTVNIIENKSNLGIGMAQNIAINIIKKEEKAEYIFFLDQDSFITQQSLALLLKDIKELQKSTLVGCLAANSKEIGKNIVSKEEVISSGMLIPISSIKKIGMMKDDLFIDMIDYEWCWRAIKKGFALFEDERVIFKHQIGSEKKVLNKQIIAPFRLYYVFRNTLYLVNLPDYRNHKKKWTVKLFKQAVFNIVFCPEKKERLYFIYRGIKDAKNKHLGKLSM